MEKRRLHAAFFCVHACGIVWFAPRVFADNRANGVVDYRGGFVQPEPQSDRGRGGSRIPEVR